MNDPHNNRPHRPLVSDRMLKMLEHMATRKKIWGTDLVDVFDKKAVSYGVLARLHWRGWIERSDPETSSGGTHTQYWISKLGRVALKYGRAERDL